MINNMLFNQELGKTKSDLESLIQEKRNKRLNSHTVEGNQILLEEAKSLHAWVVSWIANSSTPVSAQGFMQFSRNLAERNYAYVYGHNTRLVRETAVMFAVITDSLLKRLHKCIQ